jgi:hypothetical protein
MEEHEITLQFSSKKDFNRFLKNMSQGKGFVVKHDNVRINGEGVGKFFKDVGRALRPVTRMAKPIVKKILPLAGNLAGRAVGAYYGGPAGRELGGVVGSVTAGEAANGMGINLRTVGRKIRNTVKDVKSALASNDAKALGRQIGRARRSGLGRELESIGKMALHEAIDRKTDQILEGLDPEDSKYSQMALGSLNRAGHSAVGSGFAKKKGRLAKGSAEAKEHMRRIREMKGGSIMPIYS